MIKSSIIYKKNNKYVNVKKESIYNYKCTVTLLSIYSIKIKKL